MLAKRSIAAIVAALMFSAVSSVAVAETSDVQKSVNVCNKTLAALHKVTAAQVKAFSGNSWVLPLCQVTAEVRAADLDSSKVVGLIDAIAGNPTLMATLKSKGYKTKDIVGFSISVDGARIFVHRQ
jgi:hypothetical protein